MAKAKTATLSFRIKPTLKDALRAAAEREHRSIANMVEVMVLDYCGRNGVAISDQDGSSGGRLRSPTEINKTAGNRRNR